jgi:uncharacterized protein YraI
MCIKRVLPILFLVIILCLCETEAAKFNIGDSVEVTDNLNVRTGAGVSYPEISVMS